MARPSLPLEPWWSLSRPSLIERDVDLCREAFFLDSARGRLFCLSTMPRGELRGTVLFVPPLAEEMNKSRHMVALAAQAFARRGWLVLQVDLYGTGDSEGDFGEASWEIWLDDLACCQDWLERRAPGLPGVLWSLRFGSLLASAFLHRSVSTKASLLLWQPIANGRQHLTQFLRLKAASEMLTEADARSAMSRFRAVLDQGEPLEVAGYRLSPALAQGIEAAVFAPPAERGLAVHALEVVSGGRDGLSPALGKLVHSCKELGVPCEGRVVDGPPFWSSQEIELAPMLIEASTAILDEWR